MMPVSQVVRVPESKFEVKLPDTSFERVIIRTALPATFFRQLNHSLNSEIG